VFRQARGCLVRLVALGFWVPESVWQVYGTRMANVWQFRAFRVEFAQSKEGATFGGGTFSQL